jgi:hypothetical protein
VVDKYVGGDARILDIAQIEKMPKKIPEGMTELSVYIDKDVKLRFKVACTKQGKPMGEVVNTLLKEWLQTNE